MQALDLFAAARACLVAADPAEKIALTHLHAARLLAQTPWPAVPDGELPPTGGPGRPGLPKLIDPRQLPHRGLGSSEGRAALVHAIAHIEFNAVNLAWDAVLRFRGMPEAYYRDWLRVAADEARHFDLLVGRLAQLGHRYGDFDAHDGLWEMATRTAHSCLERMALVPRVLEARGLDVTPAMITRLRNVSDHETANILEVILSEEVAHVAAGSHWFAWCCARDGLDAESTFGELLERYHCGGFKGPLNTEARLRAGFSAAEIAHIGMLAA